MLTPARSGCIALSSRDGVGSENIRHTRDEEEPVSKSVSERIEELMDQIADPETPMYRVEYLEKKVRVLRKLEDKNKK